MKAYLINTHLLVPRSRSSAKVKYQDYISQKMAVSGALVFYKHILFLIFILVKPLPVGGKVAQMNELKSSNIILPQC